MEELPVLFTTTYCIRGATRSVVHCALRMFGATRCTLVPRLAYRGMRDLEG